MSKNRWFNCSELNRSYKSGHLDSILKKYKGCLSDRNFISAGHDASVFRWTEGQVLKLTTKKIKYFSQYKKTQGQARGFQTHINSLGPFLAPVESIIYEDKNIFIYTQTHCQSLGKVQITPRIAAGVFELVQFLLRNNVLLTDLAPHNLGLLGSRVVVFDYHGLSPLKKPSGRVRRARWWCRLARNLTRFMCAVKSPHNKDQYVNIMQTGSSSGIRKIREDRHIPKCFGELLQYMSKYEEKADLKIVDNLLEQCINELSPRRMAFTPKPRRISRSPKPRLRSQSPNFDEVSNASTLSSLSSGDFLPIRSRTRYDLDDRDLVHDYEQKSLVSDRATRIQGYLSSKRHCDVEKFSHYR